MCKFAHLLQSEVDDRRIRKANLLLWGRERLNRLKLTSDDFSAVAELHEQPLEVFDRVCAVANRKTIDAGHEILRQQHSTNELYFVLSGSVRVNMMAASGRQITYQILGAGELFGEVSAVDGQSRSASISAETDCTLAILDRPAFLDLLNSTPGLALIILQRFARLSRWLTTKVYEYHTYDVRGRVYSELLRLHHETNVQAPNIEISDKDMASRVGTTRANVTRVFGVLKKKGIAKRSHGKIFVDDPDALAILIGDSEFS